MMKVSVVHSAEMASLCQKAQISAKEIHKLYPQYSKATIYRHCSRVLANDACLKDKRTKNKGRPSKLSIQDRRLILRTVEKLRRTDGSFTSPRIALEAGLSNKVSNRTIRRVLNSAGYRYRRSRKKGPLKLSDLKSRVSFCRNIRRRKLGQKFWNESIAIYIDGKGFAFKTNPMDQARAPKAREWRLKNEGLKFGCTAKGCKEGVRNANFMVGISYGKGVTLCQQYSGSITGAKFATIVQDHMPASLENSADNVGKRILQDGCPRQNSRTALRAIEDVGGLVFRIPPRSPDLNPIENFFSLVTKELRKQVIRSNLTRETFGEFSARVRSTMLDFPINKIDSIIGSMSKRVNLVIQRKGMRLKY